MRAQRRWLALILIVPAAARAQQHDYVALDDPGLAMFDYLVARGDIVDPSPQVRPFQRSDAIQALRAARIDTATSSGRVAAELLRRWSATTDSVSWRVAARGGGEGYTSGRRDVLDPAGGGAASAYIDAGAWLDAGPFAVGSRVISENRLDRDPDWTGDSAQRAAGLPFRVAEGWISGSWAHAVIHYGQIDRQWGPTFVPGLALANGESYARPDLAIGVRAGPLRATALVRSLDGTPDANGRVVSRTFMAHRLDWHASNSTHLALWEDVLVGGPADSYGRAAVAALYPAALALLAGSRPDDRSVILGADASTRVARRVHIAAQLAIRRSGAHSDASSVGDRLGANLTATGAAGSHALWIVTYSRVPATLYFASAAGSNTLSFEDRGAGLIQTVADQDRITAGVAWPWRTHWLLTPGIAMQRRGPAQPGDSVQPDAGFLAGTVERTREINVAVTAAEGVFRLSGQVALQDVRNTDNVEGRSTARVEARVVATIGWTWRGNTR